MLNSSSSLTEYISCPICCKVFDEIQQRPISLRCGHTVCKSCLYNRLGDGEKRCPFDQFELPTEIDKLPSNFALLQLIGATVPGMEKNTTSESIVDKPSYYEKARKCVEDMAVHLKPLAENASDDESSTVPSKNVVSRSNSLMDSSDKGRCVLSRPLQKKLISLIHCQLAEEEGRSRSSRIARAIGERIVSELLLLHQFSHQLSANLWAAVRTRGCQFLGPAMQEEVLKLILLALEDGSFLARKVLVLFVVQRLECRYPQASKTAIGHVVQLLYRASCFKVLKREEDSSLMQLKEEFRQYEALRREHDSQIVQIAIEAGLRISPDQWSSLLYGDSAHKSHMQSIIDKHQGPQSFAQSITELMLALQRNGDPSDFQKLRPQLEFLSNVDPNNECPAPSWENLEAIMRSLCTVVKKFVEFLSNPDHKARLDSVPVQNARYKTSMCRDYVAKKTCPRGNTCTFAHSAEELERYRLRFRRSIKPKLKADEQSSNHLSEEEIKQIQLSSLSILDSEASESSTVSCVHSTNNHLSSLESETDLQKPSAPPHLRGNPMYNSPPPVASLDDQQNLSALDKGTAGVHLHQTLNKAATEGNRRQYFSHYGQVRPMVEPPPAFNMPPTMGMPSQFYPNCPQPAAPPVNLQGLKTGVATPFFQCTSGYMGPPGVAQTPDMNDVKAGFAPNGMVEPCKGLSSCGDGSQLTPHQERNLEDLTHRKQQLISNLREEPTFLDSKTGAYQAGLRTVIGENIRKRKTMSKLVSDTFVATRSTKSLDMLIYENGTTYNKWSKGYSKADSSEFEYPSLCYDRNQEGSSERTDIGCGDGIPHILKHHKDANPYAFNEFINGEENHAAAQAIMRNAVYQPANTSSMEAQYEASSMQNILNSSPRGQNSVTLISKEYDECYRQLKSLQAMLSMNENDGPLSMASLMNGCEASHPVSALNSIKQNNHNAVSLGPNLVNVYKSQAETTTDMHTNNACMEGAVASRGIHESSLNPTRSYNAEQMQVEEGPQCSQYSVQRSASESCSPASMGYPSRGDQVQGQQICQGKPTESVDVLGAASISEAFQILLPHDFDSEFCSFPTDDDENFIPFEHSSVSRFGPISRMAKARTNNCAPVQVTADTCQKLTPVLAATPSERPLPIAMPVPSRFKACGTVDPSKHEYAVKPTASEAPSIWQSIPQPSYNNIRKLKVGAVEAVTNSERLAYELQAVELEIALRTGKTPEGVGKMIQDAGMGPAPPISPYAIDCHGRGQPWKGKSYPDNKQEVLTEYFAKYMSPERVAFSCNNKI